MKMKHYWAGGMTLRRWFLFNFLLLLFLAGCVETAVSPTATAEPSDTIVETAVSPSATAEPSDTIVETAVALTTPTSQPEPAECQIESQEPLRILALGDSYTIGERVAETERFPNQLAVQLTAMGIATEPPTIVAQTGWTTGELISAIQRSDLQPPYDLVTLLIGVNNQFRGRDMGEYETEFESLLQTAVAFADGNPAHVFVLSIPDWGVTPFGQRRNPAQIAQEIDQFNQANERLTAVAGANYIDITPISRQDDPELVATDGLHPSGKQYGLWVDQLLPVVCSTFE